jgi:LEA14-like dessication related protein
MRRSRRSILLLTLTGAFFAAGCIGRVREPEITLAGVKVGGIGLRGASLIAQLDIMNPNSFALETARITYDLKVSDTGGEGGTWLDLARGEFREPIKVDDGGTTRVEIPIEFAYTALSGALRSIVDRGTFNYHVEGRVALREPLRREIPYRHRGNVSLQGIR